MSRRAVWAISKDTWHGKIYRQWRKEAILKTGEVVPYKENLCHYIRVVLIWGPISIFFLRPLFLGLSAAVWIMSIILAGLIIAAMIMNPLNVLAGLGVAILALALGALIHVLIAKHEDKFISFGRGIKNLAYRFIGSPILRFWRKYSINDKIHSLFMLLCKEIRIFSVKVPVCLFLVAAVGLIVGFVFSLPSIAITGVFLIPIFALVNKHTDKESERQKKSNEKIDDGKPNFRSVAYDFFVSKKHRVCPLIEVD